MSQDRSNQPEQPQRPRRQPFWKVQTIRFLRALIGLLEGAIQNLEQETRPPSTEEESLAWGDAILAKIRSVLPASVNQRLSDFALTGIISSIVVVILTVIVILIPNTPPEVAQVPPQVVTPPLPQTRTPPVVLPEPNPPQQEQPSETVILPEPEQPSETIGELPVPEPTPTDLETPPELAAPAPPVPVEIAPPPPPILTPEQRLIAAIQNQVSEVTKEYADGLIQSLQADFLRSLLVVRVSAEWYELTPQRQNQLANEMFQQAKELDFAKLEITDVQGSLLARSPVVGSTMVIVQRQKLSVS